MEDEENVSVREPALLELYRVGPSDHAPEHGIVDQVDQKCAKLLLEDA